MNNPQCFKDKKEFSTIRPLLKYLSISEEVATKEERPDFTFMYYGHKVGLELLTCCPSSKYEENGRRSLAAINKGKRLKAVEEYKQLLVKRKENIVIDIQFNRNAFWNHEPQHDFVNKVIEEIEDLRNKNKEKFRAHERIVSDNNIDTKYVESTLLVPINLGVPFVINNSGLSMQQITQDDFDRCVIKKYQKLYKYKKLEKNSIIEEYWLAVAVNDKEFYEFWDASYDTSLNTGYKRIFLIGYEGVREI